MEKKVDLGVQNPYTMHIVTKRVMEALTIMDIIEAIQNLLSKLDGKPEFAKIYNDLSDLQDELATEEVVN